MDTMTAMYHPTLSSMAIRGSICSANMFDETTLEQLYDAYADKIYRFLYWHCGDEPLAEDLTGEVFFRAWKHRTSLQKPESRQAWLYKTAQNLLTDYWRKKRPESLPEHVEIESSIDIHESAIKSEESELLHSYVHKLKPDMKTVVILRFFEHLPAEDVGKIMNKSAENVRVIQYRALRQLKSMYEKKS